MGRSRAEIQSQRLNENPEHEPTLLNIGLYLQLREGKVIDMTKSRLRYDDGLESIQVHAASEFKSLMQ